MVFLTTQLVTVNETARVLIIGGETLQSAMIRAAGEYAFLVNHSYDEMDSEMLDTFENNIAMLNKASEMTEYTVISDSNFDTHIRFDI